ncbi:MAG: hypothetical protein Q9228_000927 [Teloschistes exilis]
MLVTELPLPAFECIIEHMVLTAGLYHAVRLRRVCKAFDHEVRHAMFATELFDFSKHGRIKHMTIEYRRMWLMAKVVKPSPDENNIRSVVNTITDTLLGDTTEFDLYSRDIDEIMHPTRNGLSIMDEDLFCAAIALLLDQNAAPNARSCYGRPLFFAAKTDHVEVVQLLLEHGADINARGYKHSILTGAARNGETTMVEYPLQRGVDLTAYTNGDTALKSAVQWGHEDTVRLLVRLGVNVNGLRTSGHSPMLKAMLFGQQNIIEVLAELGAQRIDPLQTAYAYEFKQGSYPLKCPVVPWSLWRSPHRK